MSQNLFVMTGGPGSGKTSLLRAMARRGLPVTPEAGRAIIRDQIRIGGSALPWGDRALFAELMLSWDMRSYRKAQGADGPVLMDRGIPDIIGYLTLCGLPVPQHIAAAARLHPYHPRVFLAPHWDAIYENDAERRQDRSEAQATARIMAQTYAGLGYRVVELPLTGIETRSDFVAAHLRDASGWRP